MIVSDFANKKLNLREIVGKITKWKLASTSTLGLGQIY